MANREAIGVYVSSTNYSVKSLHSTMRNKHMFVTYGNYNGLSWALEEHPKPEIQPVNMQLV